MASSPEYDFELDNSLPSFDQSDSASITSESSILPAEFIEENYFRCDDDLINTVYKHLQWLRRQSMTSNWTILCHHLISPTPSLLPP